MKKSILLFTAIIALNISLFSIRSFAQWNQTLLDSGSVNCFVISGGNIFAGAGTFNDGAIYLSSDNGSTWISKSNGLPSTNNVVTAMIVKGDTLFAATENGVYISTNNGGLWTLSNTGLTDSGSPIIVESFMISENKIYAGTSGYGVYVTSNNGLLWTALNTGIAIESIEALIMKGDTIFAGAAKDGIFMSTDYGNSWDSVNTGLTNRWINAFIISGNKIFAGANGLNGSVFVSTNDGASWSDAGGLTNYTVNGFVMSGSKIFAASDGGSVFMTSNNGNNWDTLNSRTDNPFMQYVRAIAISGPNIIAGTFGTGIYIMPLAGAGLQVINSEESNMKVYPNPALNNLTIETPQSAVIEILNLQGQLINTFKANNDKTSIDVSTFPCGVYEVVVKTEKGIEVCKFVKE